MAKISYREKILLGYNPNTLLSNSSSSRRNSADVDFSDVFGGPPRCSSSTQEYYHYNNDIDSIDENDDDDADNYGNGFGLSEKPVFGYHQKRFGSDDFYDDIFGGDQFVLSSSLSSPRVVLMSPPRTSSSAAAEPSSPSKFSLPGRAANTDTTSTSMNQSLTKFFGRSLSRFNHTVQKHLTINSGDAHTSNLSSSLPSRIAVDEKRLTGDSKIKGTRDQHEPKFNMEGSKSCSKVANDTMQFHFSIYKWANTGVPSVMTSRKRSPSRPKERMTSDVNLIMEDSKRNVINVNVNVNVNEATLSSKHRMPSTAAQEREHERNNNDIAAGGGKSHVEWKLKDDKVKNNNTSSNNEVGEGHSEKDLEAKLIKQPQKIKKSNTKPLRTLFGQEKEGSKKATVEKGRKQSKVNETEQQPSLKNEVFPNHKVSRKSKVQLPSIGKTDDLRKGEVSEIAKDFVKIFNQGSSHEKNYVSTFPTKNHDEMQASYGNLGNISFESIEVVDGESFLSGEQEFNINSSGIPNSASNDGPSNDSSRASAPKTTAPYVEEDLGKVVTQDMDSPLAIESKEETQSYERKVRQWSKGKEGNIRALLSTMQNILWPNSGWKPVPLVDIIEANAVKKAYQRALLCLHPDKLQQKGAAPHHKFIAEKVFDVLQEAWDQFNSLGTL